MKIPEFSKCVWAVVGGLALIATVGGMTVGAYKTFAKQSDMIQVQKMIAADALERRITSAYARLWQLQDMYRKQPTPALMNQIRQQEVLIKQLERAASGTK